jgi:hypothetical protein
MTSMNTFVYLGPSLPRARAESILPAVYLDPIAMGDLYTLVRTRAKRGDRIAIIDGFFEQVPAVWHKEILYAIKEGVTVYGASSMGALRAAELHRFGMRGAGRIFEAYRDLVIEDDDEVAVAHATREEGYRSLSTAMVSIRFGLERLRAANKLSLEQHDVLCAHAKSQHYNVRSWADTYACAADIGYGKDVLEALDAISQETDAKGQDAIALLQHLAETSAEVGTPAAPEFVLEQTGLWRDLTQSQDARIAGEALEASLDTASIHSEVIEHVRAASRTRDMLLREALLMKIGTESGITAAPTSKEMKAAMFRIATKNSLSTSSDLRKWREKHRISDADWFRILEMDARVHQMALHATNRTDAYLLAALKACGQYDEAVLTVKTIHQRYGQDWLKQLTVEEAGVGYADLQHWYEQHYGAMLPDPETYAQTLGFQSLSGFVAHILAQFLLEHDVVNAAPVTHSSDVSKVSLS